MWCGRCIVVAALMAGCSSGGSQVPSSNVTLGGTISGPIASAEDQIAAQDELIRRQEEEFRRQALELQDLKRQEYHNQRVRKYEIR